MALIAVFDSGLGSLGIVNAIRAISRCDIIYYADTASYPYGKKPADVLENIIRSTISGLRRCFRPDLIVVGSNTPTLTLNIDEHDVIGVRPPLTEAARITRNNSIAVLVTQTVVRSGALEQYVRSCNLDPRISVRGIDSTILVDLVESGRFLGDTDRCRKVVDSFLGNIGDADICTLSSTHLPFLHDIMSECRTDVTFLDPADIVARHVTDITGTQGRGRLSVYSSGEYIQDRLAKLGIMKSVARLGLFEIRD